MVIPLFDQDPLERDKRAYVTYAIIALNIVIFLIQIGSDEEAATNLLRNFALIPVAIFGDFITGGYTPPTLGFVTYMFLHAGWSHILFNLLFLWIFGDNIEDALGRRRYIVFYLLCGIAGGAAYAFSDPMSNAPLIGASGAIAGVLAAYLMLRPCAKVEVLVIIIPLKLDAWIVIGLWMLTQVWNLINAPHGAVAWWAHIGGALAGAVLIVVMRPAGIELFDCYGPAEFARDHSGQWSGRSEA